MIAVVFGGAQRAIAGKIAFESNRDADGDYEIFVMDDDGTDQTQLTFNTVGDYAWPPIWRHA